MNNVNPHEYSDELITVIFNPSKCINAEKCAQGLPSVFRQTIIPWIKLDGASPEAIAKQVSKCPSGALSCVIKTQKVAS